jgi:hypothetical protein
MNPASFFEAVSVKFHVLDILRHPSKNTKLAICHYKFFHEHETCPQCAMMIVRCELSLVDIAFPLPPRKPVRCSAGLRASFPIADLVRMLQVCTMIFPVFTQNLKQEYCFIMLAVSQLNTTEFYPQVVQSVGFIFSQDEVGNSWEQHLLFIFYNM